MEILSNDQLDLVSGGQMWWVAVVAFVYLNLDKIAESWQGLSDGFNAGLNGDTEAPATECTP